MSKRFTPNVLISKFLPAFGVLLGAKFNDNRASVPLENATLALSQEEEDFNPPDGLSLAGQVAYCWRNWQAGKVLLVFDDVKDWNQIKPYLPPKGSRYHSQRRYSDAEPFYIKALAMTKRLLGDEHPDVATSLNNLAFFYHYSQRRYSDAEPLYIEALAMTKRLLGDEHPDVATSLSNLALLYYSQGKYSDAEPLYIKALEIAEKQLGANHPKTITYRKNLEYLRRNRQPWFRRMVAFVSRWFQ